MAGVCNNCSVCGETIYDEQTIELLCSNCDMQEHREIPHSLRQASSRMRGHPAIAALKKIGDLGTSVVKNVLESVDQVQTSKLTNRAKREMVKAKYRLSLAELSHSDLLEYTVSRLDNYELYEAQAILEVTPEAIQKITGQSA